MDNSSFSIIELLVDRFYAKVCDSSDKVIAREIISSDVEFYASGSDVPVGFDDFFDYISMFQKSLEFRHFILHTIADGNSALIHWRVEGTHKKELFGFAPTNKPVVYTGMTLFYINNKQCIRKAITVFDEKSFIAQLRDNPD